MTKTQTNLHSQQQFEQLCRRSRLRAYRLAYRLTGNATDAEDITQDAFVSAWHHFDGYDATCSFEGWLFRIITNRVIDLRRYHKRRQVYSLDAPIHLDTEGPSLIHERADPAADPEKIVVAPILEERLEAALRALPADYRAAILLCDVEQCSYQEVADRMHCALGTVRSRIHRARSLLRCYYLETGHSIRTRRSGPTASQTSAMVPQPGSAF